MLRVVELVVEIENVVEEVAISLQVKLVFGDGDFGFSMATE